MENHFIFQQSQWKIEKNHDLNFRAQKFCGKETCIENKYFSAKIQIWKQITKKSLSLNFRVEIMFS